MAPSGDPLVCAVVGLVKHSGWPGVFGHRARSAALNASAAVSGRKAGDCSLAHLNTRAVTERPLWLRITLDRLCRTLHLSTPMPQLR